MITHVKKRIWIFSMRHHHHHRRWAYCKLLAYALSSREKPKDIAPSIFAISKHKNFTVHNDINQEFLIAKIKTNEGITINHLTEFVELWTRV
jgi:hypothetical protein